MLNSGITKFRTMTQENQSYKSEENKTKDLEKKVDQLERTLELVKKTLDHDKEMKLQQPKEFGKYEMT